MNHYELLIYPAILLLVTFYGCRLAKRNEFVEQIWSREESRMLQAVACVGVILHHVTQQITSYGQAYKGPITIMSSMGILFTSIFFFFSGYGLITSIRTNPEYLDGFLKHRLTIILVPFFVCNCIHVLVRLYVQRIPTTGINIVKAIFGLVLLNGNGWFIVEIFYLYIIFYLLFRFLKNKDLALALLCLATCLIIYVGYCNGHDTSTVGDHWFMGEWWYNSTIVFIMGLLFARFKEGVVGFAKKYYPVHLVITTVLFLIIFRWEEYILNTCGYYREFSHISNVSSKSITLCAQMLLCIIFMWLVLLICMKVSLGNVVLKKLGLISTEVFLVHGLFLNSIFDFKGVKFFYIYLIVLVCGIAAAAVVHVLDSVIISHIHSIGKSKDYLRECNTDLIRERKDRKIRLIKRILIIVILLMLGVGLISNVYNKAVRQPRESAQEIEEIGRAQVGDIVRFGRYETNYLTPGDERIDWIVLDIKDGNVLLISRDALAGGTYHAKHEEISWADSDMHSILNEQMYPKLFSEGEMAYIADNPETGDKLSLLSALEADKYFTDDYSRQVVPTSVAIKEGTNLNSRSKVNYWDEKGYRASWWWLRSDEKGITTPIVTVDGIISEDEKYVNKPNGAIRPVVWVAAGNASLSALSKETAGYEEEQAEYIHSEEYEVRATDKEDSYDFIYEGLEHRIIVCPPENIDEDTDVLLMLHGYGATATAFKTQTEMEKDANRRNYIVVYVTGAPDKNDPTSSYGWNASWNSKPDVTEKDDVGLLMMIARYIGKEYGLDNPKNFVAGFSNGAFMIFRLAMEQPEVFTACASVAGRMNATTWEHRNEAPTSAFLQISGTSDDVVPMKLTGTDKNSNIPAIEDVLDYFAKVNGCSDITEEKLSKKTTLTRYSGGESKEIWFALIEDGRHSWPESAIAGFDTNELILDFFDEYRDRKTASIVMVGDILLHDKVEDSARLEDGSYDYEVLFANTRDKIGRADLALVNEEVIIGGTELGISGYPAFNAPYEIAAELEATGFDVACHATNHALDKGGQGIRNTLSNWKNYPGIDPIGIHDSSEDQQDIYITEVDGIRIAVLNYTYGTNGISLPADMPYGVDYLGENKVISDIERAEREADFTIVCPHWGTEYRLTPDAYQEKWTKIFLENGVDLVIGTHPHVIEPYEMLTDEDGHEMLVYYSLGNFVNWTSGSGAGTGNRMVGGMADVTISKASSGKVTIDRYTVDALVCHLEEGYGGVTTYFVKDYTKELAEKNLIRKQDGDFDYQYVINLCNDVWGADWK